VMKRFIHRLPACLRFGWLPALGLLLGASQLPAQESLRVSLAGDVAAAQRKAAENSVGYYNLLWGPVAWRFSSGLGLDYNDNVQRVSQKQEGDFIIRPNLDTQMHWPVTQKNSLDVALGAGYSLYASHSEMNRFYVNPGSGLSFDIYAGDCVINLHDRISITQNAYQNPTVGGNQNYARLENSAGVSTLWDLNKLMAQIGYEHANSVSLGSSQQASDTTSENWFLNAGVHFLPEITAGVEGGYGLMSYSQSQSTATQPDAMHWNTGVFCQAQISEYISGRLDAGYTVYTPSSTGAFTNLSSVGSLYFQFSVSHRVNRFLNYSLSAGRSTESSAYGQPYDRYFVRLEPSWTLFKNYQLSTPIFWEKGSQLANQLYGSGGSTDYNQYGAGINIGRSITQKLSGTLGYQFVRESSGQSGLNYTANIVSLNFSYRF
jgi:hypothetical protein